LNVLLVVSSYLPHVGGLQRVTCQLAQGLAARGIRVRVLAPRHPRSLPARERIDGIEVRRLFFILPRAADVKRGRLDLFAAGLFFAPWTFFRLFVELARFSPTVVNLHFVGAPAPFLLAATMFKSFRYVVSLHGDDVQGFARGTWFDRWTLRATLGRADAVTACSQTLLNEALAIQGTAADKARVIPNGITLPEISPAPARDMALGVGRMVTKKGFDVLLDAFAQSSSTEKSLQLVLIGDGPERQDLERRAVELTIRARVEFRGAQSQSEVYDAMRHAKFIVVPSLQEPFGMVALEAMALGKPIVASRVGGLPELLQNADAILVEPNDAAAVAQGIQAMLERLAREPQYGARNRERALQYTTTSMVDKYLGLYGEGE
jgi:glycosyltransferase involved in cell wall biosynthesis